MLKMFVATVCTALGVAISFAAAPLAARADESPSFPTSSSFGQKERIEHLIKLLASKNKRPGADPKKTADTYDLEAQAVVYAAVQQLLREGEAAYDQLLAAKDIKAYSYSFQHPSNTFHETVADACNRIMNVSIRCFENRIPYFDRRQTGVTPWGATPMKQWWAANRTRPLWELQVEAIDAQLALHETLKYEEWVAPFKLSSRPPQEEYDRDRLLAIAVLRELRNQIAASKSPHLPTDVDAHAFGYSMTSLPWPTSSQPKQGR